MADEQNRDQTNNQARSPSQESSALMNTLVLWNISKAVESKPNLDLKVELKEAEASLAQNMNVSDLVTLSPHKRHISCALLAWQQVGHNNADSLFQFYQSQIKLKGTGISASPDVNMNTNRNTTQSPLLQPGKSGLKSSTTSPYNIPPALKLPCGESIVMCCATNNARGTNKSCSGSASCASPNIPNKKISTCCSEPRCNEQLSKLDATCKELKQRLGKLAQREANRVKLLERAETAWVQLEVEYSRRLQAVLDKEEDVERQIKKLGEERNSYKIVSSNLVQLLKPRGAAAEKARETLREIEGKLCKQACERLKLTETAAKEDSLLSEMQCKQTQQDRDLQFKEEKALRKKALLQGQLEATRGLSYESERAMRAELSGLKDQIKQVSKQLLSEDDKLVKLSEDIKKLQEEKDGVAEDVYGCQQKCDSGMQKKMDKLLEKKNKLQELQDIVLECQCKVPIDKGVQVKRTPSIAALCLCEPEFRAVNGCSCTSLRTRLLSDLLKDLFGGLQSEMGDIAFRMPCQLLKCLENKHNWGKGSSVTMNLTKFFSQLLVEELDIAIATSIENYHARWVGATCADIVKRPIPDPGGPEVENWQDRALAARAEAMATEMAEKMFQEKVDDIIAKATEAVTQGPQPCICKPSTKPSELAVYHVQVKQNLIGERSQQGRPLNASKYANNSMKPNQDPDSKKLTKLAAQKAQPLEKPKLEKPSRNKVAAPSNALPVSAATKMLRSRKAVAPVKSTFHKPSQISTSAPESHRVIDEYWQRTQEEISQLRALIEQSVEKKNPVTIDNKFTKFVNRGAITETVSKSDNSPKKMAKKNMTIVNRDMNNKHEIKKINPKKDLRAYAVNYVCFCGMHRNKPKHSDSLGQPSERSAKTRQIPLMISKKESKQLTPPITPAIDKGTCNSSCECFNKLPSTTSIDKFLSTLTQWNLNLNDSSIRNETLEQTYGSLNEATDVVPKMYDPSKLICLSDVTNLSTIKGLPNKPSLDANKLLIESLPPIPASNSEYIAAINLDKSNEQCQAIFSNEKDKIIILNETGVEGQCINKYFLDGVKIQSDIQKNKAQTQQSIHNFDRVLRKPLSQENFTDSHNYNLIPLDQCKMDPAFEKVKKDVRVNDPQDNFTTSQNFNILRLSRSKVICVPLEQCKMGHALESVKKDSRANILRFNSSQVLHVPVEILNTELMKCEKNFSSVNNLEDATAATKPANPCECGYQIKFLGVTLANPTFDKPQKIKEHKNFYNASLPIKSVTKNIDKVINDSSIKNESSLAMEKNDTASTESEEHLQEPSCKCNAKLEEIKALISRSIQKVESDVKNNTKQNNTDKMSEANSFNKSTEVENCICCVKASVESKNLETNTFQLLEEHLRKRLNETKRDCLFKPQEEEQIISKLFKRLRCAITELTNRAKCKCEEEVSEKGSWVRAYNLLQEYLKIKISRVQCSCSPFKENKMQSLLPELTEKVCHLIENDFERLLETRKCQNFKKSSNSNVGVIKKNSSENISERTLKKNSFFSMIQKDFLVSISAQVIPNQDSISVQILPNLDDKCCEVLKIENADVKTVETQKSDVINLLKDILNQSTQYSNETVKEFNFKSPENLTSRITENHIICGDLLSETKENNSIIGNQTSKKGDESEHDIADLKCFTLDSTDINKLQENRAKINEIWKKHVSNKTDDRRIVSYIMDSVYKKKDNNVPTYYYMKDKNIHKEKSYSAQPEVCDTKSSPFNIRESLLNDSIENIKRSFEHDKTPLKNRNLKVSDELCFDSCPQISDDVSVKKCVRFPSFDPRNEQTEQELVDVTDISHSDCVCTKVPLCHVKMLIGNIEQKLTNSDCTCDSLISSVCPVHANAKEC